MYKFSLTDKRLEPFKRAGYMTFLGLVLSRKVSTFLIKITLLNLVIRTFKLVGFDKKD